MKSMRIKRGRDGSYYITQVPLPPVVPPEWLVRGGTVVGDVRSHEIESHILKGTRKVLVYLPPGYTEGDPWRYPVAYVNDGQNVFDSSTAAFGVEWGLDEIAQSLIEGRKIQPLVMVAVYNSSQRMQEYTPTRDGRRGGGHAEHYGRFLVEELKPWIESRYQVSKRAADTCILGSSLGGLVSLYLGWSRPDVFGLVAALSPSLWWAGRDLIAGIAGDPKERGPHRIWMDVGTAESLDDSNGNGVPDVVDDLRAMRAVLAYKGYKLEQDLFYREVEGATHSEADWGKRIGDVLQALFPFTGLDRM